MPTRPRSLLSSASAAQVLGVAHRSVTRWASEGLIPSFKLEGKTGAYVFDPADIDQCRLNGLTREGRVVLHAARYDVSASDARTPEGVAS